MKTFIAFVISIVLMVSWVHASDQRGANNFKVFSGQTIFASGNSVVVVDLRDPRYDKVVEFDFSVQLSGVTNTEGSYLSGSTIDAIQFVTLPTMPSGNVASDFSGILTGSSVFTAKLPWVTVVNDIDIKTGNTEYPVPLYAEKGKLLLIRVINGAADLLTDLWLDMD